MLPQAIKDNLESQFGRILSFKPASGGCINHGGILDFGHIQYFVKWNDASRYPEMFDAESNGLKLLTTGKLKIPEVIFNGVIDQLSFLVLEAIIASKRRSDYWELLGQGLAEQHLITNESYGLNEHNYIGSLKQLNTPHNDWIEFFISQRIEPQIRLARDSQLLSEEDSTLFSKFYKILPNVIVIEQPALLHGDLWNGNIMTNAHGEPVLIDPAVSYGHREMDLAMTTLFGGFDSSFYQSYQNSLPTEKGLQDRLDIYNFYPLMVHLNLFGRGYYAQIKSVLKRFL